MQVRGDRQPRRAVGQRRPAGGRADEAGDADELLVDLVVERLGGLADRLQRTQRGRDLGTVGVVLRAVDVRARRQADDERDPAQQGRAERRGQRRAQPRPAPAAHGQRDERAERQAAGDGDEDRQAQVEGERVARLAADELGVERARLGQPDDLLAVDRAHVDVDPRRRRDDREAHAPVDERNVEIQRTVVPGVDRQPYGADVELALERERGERRGRPGDRGDDDGREREQLAHGPSRLVAAGRRPIAPPAERSPRPEMFLSEDAGRSRRELARAVVSL